MPSFDYIEDLDLRQKAVDEFNTSLETEKATFNTSLQSEIDKATSGLKASHSKLLDEKKKLQERFQGITNPEEALQALKLISENEEMQMLRDGKFEDVIQRRLSTKLTEFEDSTRELNTKLEMHEISSTKYKTMYADLIIDNNLRKAASKAGVLSAAMDDVLNKGRNLFSVADDEKSVESRDHNGKLRKTEDEKVLTPENWVDSLKRTSPHYWPASQSANFVPGGGGSADDLEVRIQAAATAGNTKLFRELRDQQKKMQSA